MRNKRKINWDKQIQYAQRQLDLNKAQIEDTVRGTNSFKPSTWAIKPKQNRSKIF
ncbi:MAG: hypothetical protein ACO3CQ_08130 [Candidatus Nanopelagicaceae bacterium]